MRYLRAFSFVLVTAFLAANLLIPAGASAGQATANLRLDNDLKQGMSLENLPLLYAPADIFVGSSISHWDPSATPDLLMEPHITRHKAFGQLDITPLVMQDIGWHLGNSTINIFDGDVEGTGFTDPRPFAGAPGNPAATLGEARQNLIAAVLDAWASTLQSPVAIDVVVSWVPLECSEDSGILGLAGPTEVFRDELGLPEKNIWYHSALAEALIGQNLTGDPEAGGDPDIYIYLNSAIDEGCLGAGTGFYYGLDGNEPERLENIGNTVLHELAHGLGFLNLIDETTGLSIDDIPSVFDQFTFDQTLRRNWVRMSAAERVFSASNDKQVVWTGERAVAGATELLEPGTPLLEVNDLGTFFVGAAVFGAPLTAQGVTAELACGYDAPVGLGGSLPSIRDACQTITNPQDVAGRLVLVDSGACLFVTQALRVQAAGAAGLLIVNSEDVLFTPGSPPGQGSQVTIPVALMNYSDGEFLRSVVCPTALPANLHFAQWVNGEFSGQANSVRVILRNLLDTADSGSISFLNSQGALTSPDGGAAAPIPYSIAPFGTFEFETSGTGPLQSGVIEVRSEFGPDADLVGTEVFRVLGRLASVPSSTLRYGHSVYVSVNSSENSGVALYNRHPELWVRILLILADDEGYEVAETELDLAPGQQKIGFVDEAGFFRDALADYPSGFKGSLYALTFDGPQFAMLGLIQTADGSLITTDTAGF